MEVIYELTQIKRLFRKFHLNVCANRMSEAVVVVIVVVVDHRIGYCAVLLIAGLRLQH